MGALLSHSSVIPSKPQTEVGKSHVLLGSPRRLHLGHCPDSDSKHRPVIAAMQEAEKQQGV